MQIIESEYNLGDEVYLKTDKEQDKRIVKQILFNTKGIEYNLACGVVNTWHAGFEMTKEANILVKTN